MDTIVLDDPEAVAHAAASRVATALAAPRPVTLGLAGGRTPEATYRILVDAPIDWNRVTMWLGDERWVPPDDPNSNERMVRAALVDAVRGNLLSPDYTHGDPVIAAGAYGAALEAAWTVREGLRVPDLVLLGMGPDGHTASLFPGSAMLDAPDRTYVAGWVEAKNTWRLSATLSLLRSARDVIFLVTGGAKADVVARILDRGEPFPAQRVAAGAHTVTWLLDEDAASALQRRPR
ncbi:MAG: 6-phosphogluconolactonase [Acidimicrobiia bacterium]